MNVLSAQGLVRLFHGAQCGRAAAALKEVLACTEFKNVSASYDGELAVLADVSFTVNDGDFVAFVGTNGAGKSTTMRLANGFCFSTSGEVLIDGVPTISEDERAGPAHRLPLSEPDRQICCNTVREERAWLQGPRRGRPGSRGAGDAMIERFGFDADAEPYR